MKGLELLWEALHLGVGAASSVSSDGTRSTTSDSPDYCSGGTGCHGLMRDATGRTSSPSNY